MLPPKEKWLVDSTSICPSQVDGEIESKYLNFRPTLYLLKTASRSVSPRELSLFTTQGKSKGHMPFRRRNDVNATSSSKFGRTFLKDFVYFDFFRSPLRRRIDVDSTNHFSLGRLLFSNTKCHSYLQASVALFLIYPTFLHHALRRISLP